MAIKKDQAENFMKQGFENMAQNVDQISNFTKQNFDALMETANRSAKAAEEIMAQTLSFSKKNIEENVSMAKEFSNIRSLDQFISLQTDYSKKMFEKYVEQMTKLSEMVVSNSKTTIQPINERFSAFTEAFSKKVA